MKVTWRETLAVAAAFLALTVVATYPQVIRLTSVGSHHDALFSIWRLAWIAHQLPRDPRHLFDANIFYPESNTLAFSDALLLPGVVVAPMIWAGVAPVVAYNALLLLSFASAGVAMYLLVRVLTGSKLAGAFSGVFFAFHAYRYAHYAQLELLWSCWIPLALLALDRMIETRKTRDGLFLGLMLALQALSCLYYAVFLATGLLVLAVVLTAGRAPAFFREILKPSLAAVAVGAIVIAPYAIPYLQTRALVGTRSPAEIAEWSPTISNYVTTIGDHWLYGRIMGHRGHVEGILFPGLVPIALAVFGIAKGLRTRRVLAYLALLAVAFDLSLGFNGILYRAFYEYVWPYRGLRVPARMFVMVSAALAVLAGVGLAHGLEKLRQPRYRLTVALLLIAIASVEGLSVPVRLEPVIERRPAVYAWLAGQRRLTVLEWPVPAAGRLGFTGDAQYMFYSTWHWQRLVNGYSGFYPPSYIQLLELMVTFPDRRSIEHLERLGVRYVILHSEPSYEKYTEVRTRLLDRRDLRPFMVGRLGSEEVALFELPNARADTQSADPLPLK